MGRRRAGDEIPDYAVARLSKNNKEVCPASAAVRENRRWRAVG